MSDPLLPPGIKVGTGLTVDERPGVMIDIALVGGRISGVCTPKDARIFGLWLAQQQDRQIRSLGALIIRQAQLCEEAEGYRGLRVVGGTQS